MCACLGMPDVCHANAIVAVQGAGKEWCGQGEAGECAMQALLWLSWGWIRVGVGKARHLGGGVDAIKEDVLVGVGADGDGDGAGEDGAP